MGQHMTTPPEIGWVDPRRNLAGSAAEDDLHFTTGPVVFTANAVGTTTTLVGANATPGAGNTNVIRVGEKIKLFTSAGAVKQEAIFTVTNVVVGASTTVTFSPAAAVQTASGDRAKLVTDEWAQDNDSLDRRLAAINGTTYSQARLDTMTQNDKLYALRMEDDPTGF